MSLSFLSHLRASISPTAVTLVRTRGLLRPQISDAQVYPVRDGASAAGSRQWEAAIATLGSALQGFARSGEGLTVVVSNHFCHYAMLPPLASLSNADEDLAYAQHIFREIFGDAAQGWTLRVSGDAPDHPRIAGALDTALLAGVQAAARSAGVRLQSVQPLLMAAYNSFLRQLGSGWFVLQEPGRLCVCLCSPDGLRTVRGMPAADEWQEGLQGLLEREAGLQELEGQALLQQVWLFTAGAVPAAAAHSGTGAGSRVTTLRLAERPLPVGARAAELAMAMAGD